jgi:predicted Zn finger-like uncharacterized protein
MRLTCPNCGAQYEVPDAVIPVSGRDVQCSNCGNTWFQNHPDNILETPEPEPIRDPEPAPEPAKPAPRRMDPEIAGILREEAERERAVRAAEARERIETQPDLGLDASAHDERSEQARARMERLRGADTSRPKPESAPEDSAPPEEIDPRSRRNLFPDIDEINSSLSANEDNAASGPPPVLPEEALPAPRKNGFRAGFRLAVVICVIALAAYLMAPQIVMLAPGLEGPIAQFVAAVDTLRALLAQTVTGLLGQG